MPYDISRKLVVGIASSALFDLAQSDAVFREQGEDAYRAYQREQLEVPLAPGPAFSFVRRLLGLNALSPDETLVEVILLSRNDPDTGLRVFRSLSHYGLPISRAVFLAGGSPYPYIKPLNITLFLSAHEPSVTEAIAAGCPAGMIVSQAATAGAEDTDDQLRIAFDFDGVLASDESERIYRSKGLPGFTQHEREHAAEPLQPGPLRDFLDRIAAIQRVERAAAGTANYRPKLRVSLITARDAPAHERVVTTLNSWGIQVNDAFFLGGIEKRLILETLRPHIFFDDQRLHLNSPASSIALVHIPFGIANDLPAVTPAEIALPANRRAGRGPRP